MNRRKNNKRQSVNRLTEQDQIKEFYKKVLSMQEEEKKRISRDLHDETGQIVIGLGASFNLIEKEIIDGNIEKAKGLLVENRRLIQEIAGKMKMMAFNLRPPALDILGLAAALREYFSQCTKSSPIKIELKENIKDSKLDEYLEITLYRIIQEAIYNVVKHSQAKSVKVNLFLLNKRIELTISDDGCGFDVEKYNKEYDASKMGLRSISERAKILNGEFLIESGMGKGTKLTAIFPLGD